MAEKQKPICPECKSENILKDAFAEWDAEKQEWVLHSTYDAVFCQNEEGGCSAAHNGFDIKPDWVPVESIQPQPVPGVYGDLDSPVPNHFDPAKRGFDPQ